MVLFFLDKCCPLLCGKDILQKKIFAIWKTFLSTIPAILYNKYCHVRAETPKLYITRLFLQLNFYRGTCQEQRASPVIVQIHCSPFLLPIGHLAPPFSFSEGPLLGCCSADCAKLSLRPLIVSGSADFPQGRRPQTEAVCRWLGSQRK